MLSQHRFFIDITILILKHSCKSIAYELQSLQFWANMMTSSNGNFFRVTGHRWIPLTEASDAELWCFLWSVPEQTVEQTIETLVIWAVVVLIMMSLYWLPIFNLENYLFPSDRLLSAIVLVSNLLHVVCWAGGCGVWQGPVPCPLLIAKEGRMYRNTWNYLSKRSSDIHHRSIRHTILSWCWA